MPAPGVVEDDVEVVPGTPPWPVQAGYQSVGPLRAAQIGDQLGAVVAVQPGPAVTGDVQPGTGSPADGCARPEPEPTAVEVEPAPS